MALNRFLSSETGSVKVDVTNPVLKTDGSAFTQTVSNPTAEALLVSIDETLDVPGFVDPTNSTTSILPPTGAFIGIWRDVTAYSEVTVVYNVGALGSLHMDVSTDGVNTDLSKPVTNVSVGVHTLVLTAQFFRVRWVNGPDAQGHIRLATKFHRFQSKDLTSTASQLLSDKNDVAVSRVVNLPNLDIGRGIVSDKYSIHFNGSNPSSANGVWEDVWSLGGDYPFLAAATTLQIVSNDAQDAVAGLGARTVTITGLDASGLQITEDVDLVGGGTSLPTSASFLRVNFGRVIAVGTKGGSNYDDILIQTTGGTTLAVIGGEETSGTASYGLSVTRLGVATVPAFQTAYIIRLQVDSDSTKVSDIHLYMDSSVLETSAPFTPRSLLWANGNVSGIVDIDFDSFIEIPGPADVWFRNLLSSAGTAKIDVNVDVIVIDNTLN